jgi:hypothetical protein
MMFVWKHGDNFLQFPVKVVKSVSSNYGYSGHLVCQGCEGSVEQSYICKDCGTVHISEGEKKDTQDRTRLRYKTNTLLKGMKVLIGKIDKRKDDDTDLIYSDRDKKDFLESHIREGIQVIEEVKKEDLIDNIEFLDSPYEIYNNEDDDAKMKLRQTHNFCNKENVVFLATFGYKDKERCCFIISSKNKLLLFALRDGVMIKNPVQIGLKERTNNFTEKINALTENNEPKLYKDFLMAIKRGEKIEKPKAVKEEQPQVVEVPFLKGY